MFELRSEETLGRGRPHQYEWKPHWEGLGLVEHTGQAEQQPMGPGGHPA